LVGPGAVGEQLRDALLVQARDVRASAVESALQLRALGRELVAFEQQRLILVAQAVAVVFDPGPVGLSESSGEIAHEPALGCDLASEFAGPVFGVECSPAPRCFLLGGDPDDAAVGAGSAAGLRCGDDRPGVVVLVGKGS
jgi:hypothetical protein